MFGVVIYMSDLFYGIKTPYDVIGCEEAVKIKKHIES